MNRKGIVIALAMALASVGTLLYAQAARRQMRHGGLMQHVTRVFNLTDAQQTQAKAMWESEKQNVLPLLQQLNQGHKEMMAATANGAFDQAKVDSIAQQQSQTIANLLVEKEKLQSKFYQILTPEQRTKFDTLSQRRETHFENLLQRLAANQ